MMADIVWDVFCLLCTRFQMASRMHYVILLITLYSCLLCDSSTAAPSRKEAFIVGGNAVTDQIFSVVALYHEGDFICAATVISPTTILTSAQCVYFDFQLQPANLYYGIVNIDRTAPHVRIEFIEIIIHPLYRDRLAWNDIAIMKTSSPIPFDGDIPIRPICIAGSDYDIRNDSATVFGWGITSNEDSFDNFPEILHYAQQRIVHNTRECSFPNPDIIDSHICAVGLNAGICRGDAGGPLVNAGNPPVQVGLASYINGRWDCGDIPAVFTRISHFEPFIKEAANDDSICFK